MRNRVKPRYTNEWVIETIDSVIHSDRDRRLLKRWYVDGIHLEPLAEEFQLSVSQVKRIIKKGGEDIFL